MPTNYTLKRLIGAIRTEAALLTAIQTRNMGSGIYVAYSDPATIGLDVSDATLSTAKKNYTCNHLPNLNGAAVAGVGEQIQFDANVEVNTPSGTPFVWVSNPDLTDAAPSLSVSPLSTIEASAATASRSQGPHRFIADIQGRISARANTASTNISVAIFGYVWPNRL